MKRLLTTIILSLLAAAPLFARGNLNVDSFFKSKLPEANVSVIQISDNTVDGHHVKILRILSVKNSESLSSLIEQAVIKDGVNAISKEVSLKDGKLVFGFYNLGGNKEERTYLLFRNDKSNSKATLILIEGDLSEKDVKKMIK